MEEAINATEGCPVDIGTWMEHNLLNLIGIKLN